MLAQAVAAPVEAPAATTKKSQYELQTLTTWLLDLEKNGVIDNELAAVISSISTACKQIGSLVNRAGISNLTGLAGEQNVQGEDQKKLDVISNEVFGNCLRSRCGVEAGGGAGGAACWPAQQHSRRSKGYGAEVDPAAGLPGAAAGALSSPCSPVVVLPLQRPHRRDCQRGGGPACGCGGDVQRGVRGGV